MESVFENIRVEAQFFLLTFERHFQLFERSCDDGKQSSSKVTLQQRCSGGRQHHVCLHGFTVGGARNMLFGAADRESYSAC
jgi:hypothetical protein